MEKVLLSDEIKKLRAHMKKRDNEYRYRMTSCIFCDPDEISGLMCLPDILIPLVDNIYDHAMKDVWDDGFAIVQVETRPHHLTITIEDNGHGIPEDVISKINKEMLSDTPVEDESRMGPIQRRLHEAYGERGTIQIETLIDFGTTITLRFPKEK